MKGKCTKGEECKFSHDEKAVLPPKKKLRPLPPKMLEILKFVPNDEKNKYEQNIRTVLRNTFNEGKNF
jgi:hypothetical protein